MNFTTVLTQLRKDAELTRPEVAEHLNLTPAAYSKYESGARQPSFETLIRIADMFQVTTDDLLGRQGINPTAVPPELQQRISEKNLERKIDTVTNEVIAAFIEKNRPKLKKEILNQLTH